MNRAERRAASARARHVNPDDIKRQRAWESWQSEREAKAAKRARKAARAARSAA